MKHTEPKFKVGDKLRITGGNEKEGEEFVTVELIHWGDASICFPDHNHWHYGFRAVGFRHSDGYFYDEKNLELV